MKLFGNIFSARISWRKNCQKIINHAYFLIFRTSRSKARDRNATIIPNPGVFAGAASEVLYSDVSPDVMVIVVFREE
jgi:hypothetical protein